MIGYLAVLLAVIGLVAAALGSGVGIALTVAGLLVACTRLAILEGRTAR